MPWETPKTDWQDSDVPSSGGFNRIEENTRTIREQDDMALLIEVRADFPAHSAGRVFYHTADERIYTSTGTEWV
jgi:hypothetical protein